jgi:hypothetical protein
LSRGGKAGTGAREFVRLDMIIFSAAADALS